MLNVSSQNLRHAYKTHVKCLKSCANPNHPSLDLIRFYAAECGLKYLVMHKESLSNTNQIQERDRNDRKKHPVLTHDLPGIIKFLGISVHDLGGLSSPQPCVSVEGNRKTISVKDAHEALRYGIDFLPDTNSTCANSRQTLVDWLDKILQYLHSQIR
jgi:hypothetical protein